MKLLLVGGTGVLSTAITNEALKQGATVYMINRGNRKEIIPEGVILFESDINDRKKILSLLDGHSFDAVIDFLCYNEKQIDYSFNIFKNLVDQYVFISSCAVYNTAVCENECYEDSPKPLLIWPYSVNKLKCESFLMKLATQANIPYTIIRPAVTYGNTRIPYGIMPKYGYHGTIIERIKNGKPIIVWDEGETRCNITHVEDFAIGVIGLLKNTNAYNEAFNVCGNESPSWKEVLDELSEVLNQEINIFNLSSKEYGYEIPARKGEIIGGRAINAINSNRKLKEVLPSFKQTISLKEGLKKTVDYYLSNNYIYGIDYAFDADTDRIITKFAKKRGLSIESMNLHFIDYLGNASLNDKIIYWIEYNKSNLFVKFFKSVKRIIRHLKNKLK